RPMPLSICLCPAGRMTTIDEKKTACDHFPTSAEIAGINPLRGIRSTIRIAVEYWTGERRNESLVWKGVDIGQSRFDGNHSGADIGHKSSAWDTFNDPHRSRILDGGAA